MIENYYITGMPIPVEGLGIIHQPTIKEMLTNGYSEKDILQPFLLNLDLVIKDGDAELKNVLRDFDLFFMTKDDLLNLLIKNLKILYRTENVRISDDVVMENKKIFINEDVIVDRYNYDVLSSVILGMFWAERPKPKEEEKVYLPTEKHKQIWEQMKKKKKKKAMKNQMEMCDIINVVCHGNGFIPYKEVTCFTYYQLVNSYKTIMNIENYKEFTQFKLSPKFDVQQDVKHWMNQIKISKVPKVD